MSALALLMSSDSQYNFHPCFENAATEALLYSTRDVRKKIARLKEIQKKQSSALGSDSVKLLKREKRAFRKLRKKLCQHCRCTDTMTPWRTIELIHRGRSVH